MIEVLIFSEDRSLLESESKRREFVIGDIHGCIDALNALLKGIALASVDLVIVLGDTVDRGPDSRAVLEKLVRIRKECELVFILGNHEEMMLNALDGRDVDSWLRHGGKRTLESYDGDLKNVPDEHIDLLESTVNYWEGPTCICVHANLEPGVELSKQRASWLRWNKLSGREFPHWSGKRVVCGHSGVSRQAPMVHDGWVCLDTLVYNGGFLSAIEISSEEIFQSKESGEFRRGVFLHEVEN